MANTKWAYVSIDTPAKYYSTKSLYNIFNNFPSGEFESIPIVENNVVYGLKAYPYTTFYNKTCTSSGGYRGPQRVYLSTAGGKTRNILTAPNPLDYAGIQLFFHHLGDGNFDSLTGLEGVSSGTVYGVWENTTISGKYKLKIRSSTVSSRFTIPLKFSYNNKNYDMIFGIGNSTQYFYGYRFLENGWEYDTITIDNNIGNIIDFGDVPQDVPTIFLDYLNGVAEQYFPYTYTIKSYDGNTILGEFIEVPPMKKALLSVIGNRKILTLTSILDTNYTTEWTSDTPEDKVFLGLSNFPNSNRATLTINTETNISWTGVMSFYEAYGTYRPPGTPFDINLYQNTAEGNRVDKTNYLTQVGTISGALRSSTSINDLVITYESKSIPNFNYVYIPIFNRYYFVDDITSENYSLWTLALSVDPLMTYKEAIINCNGFVDRCESDFNANIIDKKRVVEEGNTIEVDTVTNELFTNTSGTYIMTALLVGFDNIEQ